MGRMSGIPSRRRRNNEQKRRLKAGLIAGSVLAVSAILFFGIKLLRSEVLSNSDLVISSSDILVENEKMMEEYMAAGDIHTITADVFAQKSKTNTDKLTGAIPGVVTPSSTAVTEGGTVTLKATANAGFTFLKWKKTKKGNKTVDEPVSDSSVITISNVKEDETYTAVFYLSAVHVTYENIYDCPIIPAYSNRKGGGYIRNTQEYIPYVYGKNPTTQAETVEAPIRCTAVPDPGFKFDHWSLDTKTSSNNPLDNISVTDYLVSVTLTAHYKKDVPDKEVPMCTLTIQPSAWGYVVAGDYYSKAPQHAPNGTSFATSTKVDEGSNNYIFTVITKTKEETGIKNIYNADSGEALNNDIANTGVGWSVGKNTVDEDNQVFQVAISSKIFKNGGNFIVKMTQKDVWHMGAIITVPVPAEGGVTSGDMASSNYSNPSTTITTTLNATPNEGYMFDRWEYYDENWKYVVSKKQQLPVAMSGFHIFTAYFVEDGYEVKAKCDPEAGGTISGTGRYKTHSDAILNAVPRPGYKFDKWTWKNEAGESFEDKNETVTIRDIQEDYNLTAHFKKANPYVTLSVNELGQSPTNGALYNYAKMLDGYMEYVTSAPSATPSGTVSCQLQNGTSVTLQAFPNDSEDYQFAYWVDQDGNTNSSNPYTVGELEDDANYIAVFTKRKDQYEIKAVSDPQGGGEYSFVITDPTGTTRTVTGQESVSVEPHTQQVSVKAAGKQGYVFEKWTWKTEEGIDHEEYTDSIDLLDIMQDYNVIAHYAKENPKLTLKVDPVDKVANGLNHATATYSKFDPSGPSSSDTGDSGEVTVDNIAGNTSVILQAYPNENNDYQFAYWIDKSGNTSTANPLVIGKITKDEEYTAIFTKKQDKYEVRLISDPDNIGTLTGEGKYNIHDNVTVTADDLNTGYTFIKWTWKALDGTEHESKDKTVTINDIREDYVLTAHFRKNVPKITVYVSPTDEHNGVYNYVTIRDTWDNTYRSDDSGKAEVDNTNGEPFTFRAFPNEDEDYEFAYWADDEGNVLSTNDIYSVSGLKTNENTYYAIFTKKKDKYDVKAISDPDGGGTFTGEGKYDPHSDATVTAVPNAGYTFEKWTWKTSDGFDHESEDNPLVLTDIMQDHTLTGHFLKSAPTVSVKVSPVGENKGVFNYVTISDTAGNSAQTDTGGSVTMTTTGDESVTLQAFPNEHDEYVFSYWVDKDGNTSPNNPYVIGKITENEEYTAIFTKKQDKYEVKLVSDPDEGGTLTGAGKYEIYSDVTVSAKANDGYKFDRWTWKALDGTEHENRNATMTINDIEEDHVLTAHFIKAKPKITVKVDPIGDKEDSYNYAEITDTDGHVGSTGSSGTTSLDVSGGDVVTLKAVANKKAHFKFAYWVDQDGNTSNANPFVIGKVTKDMTYTAIFTTEEDHDYGITVLASPPSGGKVSAKKNDDGGFDVSAKANKGYTFKYWKCVDTNKTVTEKKSFSISEKEAAKGYTYIAYFDGNKDEKFTSDIIDEYFPNIRRLFEQPNYKFTRDYWVSYVRDFISGKKAEDKPASGVPVEWNAYEDAQTAMDSKAEKSGEIVITVQSELITTDNEIIPITDAASYGNAEERAKEITVEKFGDHYEAEVICVKNVTAPDDFDDGVRTYLWYNTGAAKDDNLFIIYDQDGKEQVVSPVTDREGMLTFTLDKLGDTNRFVLVRVVIR